MDISYAVDPHTRQRQRRQSVIQRLVADIVPTLLLLIFMALGMSLVARYTESSHLKPVFANNQTLLQFVE